MRDIIRLTVKGNCGHYLRSDLKTVKHISNRGLIGTMYLREFVTLIEKQISVIKLTGTSLKSNCEE